MHPQEKKLDTWHIPLVGGPWDGGFSVVHSRQDCIPKEYSRPWPQSEMGSPDGSCLPPCRVEGLPKEARYILRVYRNAGMELPLYVYVFERVTDVGFAEWAANRAAKLLAEIGEARDA